MVGNRCCLSTFSLSGVGKGEDKQHNGIQKDVITSVDIVEEDENELEEMFVPGPSLGKIEWGGPTRGGSRPEPTRYGDWDRNGRCSDF